MKENMTFGDAIAALKEGKRVRRKYIPRTLWLEKGLGAPMQEGDSRPQHRANLPESLFDPGTEGIVTRLPAIRGKAPLFNFAIAWTPTVEDVLAEDWVILGEDDGPSAE